MSEQPTPADLLFVICPDLEHTLADGHDQCEALAAQITAAGFGPVRAVEAERDALLQQQPFRVAEANRARAEQAEAREKALRESVEAAERRMRREGSDHAAGILRDLLATSPDREGSDQ